MVQHASSSASSSSSPRFWGIFKLWKSVRSNLLGDVWQSSSASQAYEHGKLNSESHGGDKVRVAFRNCSPVPLLLCWISDQGIPHHFYTLEPHSGPLDAIVTKSDKIENTYVGHAFALAYCDDPEAASKDKVLDPKTVIGGYRPLRVCSSCTDEMEEYSFHVVTITQSEGPTTGCRPWGMLRGRRAHKQEDWHVSVREGCADKTPFDTSNKVYKEDVLGGWPVRLEPDWDKDCAGLRAQLAKDLKAAAQCLPPHARTFLLKNTPIFINRSQKYGPAVCPVSARHCCFHPDKGWLEQHGMSPCKAECVEIYEASDYEETRGHWGLGGLLLHELCHAYHWKMLEDGYDNKEIMECYESAMKEGLYDCVALHGRIEPTKAYACDNRMEYFAELSVAFLGGLDKKIEFNKWFPFNREQLKEHDPRAYKLLQRVWKVTCDSK